MKIKKRKGNSKQKRNNIEKGRNNINIFQKKGVKRCTFLNGETKNIAKGCSAFTPA